MLKTVQTQNTNIYKIVKNKSNTKNITYNNIGYIHQYQNTPQTPKQKPLTNSIINNLPNKLKNHFIKIILLIQSSNNNISKSNIINTYTKRYNLKKYNKVFLHQINLFLQSC